MRLRLAEEVGSPHFLRNAMPDDGSRSPRRRPQHGAGEVAPEHDDGPVRRDELEALLRSFQEANQEEVKGMETRLTENMTKLVQGMAHANQRRFEAVEGDVKHLQERQSKFDKDLEEARKQIEG